MIVEKKRELLQMAFGAATWSALITHFSGSSWGWVVTASFLLYAYFSVFYKGD